VASVALRLSGGMPSKYGKEFAVPKEFPSILKAFTRECLRTQPANIYEFGAEYFTQLQQQADEAAMGDQDGPRRLTPEELKELLASMFKEADGDGSGKLSLSEFQEVLKMADLGLPAKEAKKVFLSADLDDSGEIEWQEFVPVAVELVQAMYARMDAAAAAAEDEEMARQEAHEYLVHGMSKEEVESVMSEIFHKADVDGSGSLELHEFHKCCKDADIGLTRKEINCLMHQCDADGNGNISYEEFVPVCFEMLVEIMKDELMQEKRMGREELISFLVDVWRSFDPQQIGVISVVDLKKGLVNAEIGLSAVQLHSICAEADCDDEGLCDYEKFAPKASDLVYRMVDPQAQMETRAALESMGVMDAVHGHSAQDLHAALIDEFDKTTGGAGMCTQAQLRQMLQASSLGLSSKEIQGLMASASVDADGMLDYLVVASYAFHILQYLATTA